MYVVKKIVSDHCGPDHRLWEGTDLKIYECSLQTKSGAGALHLQGVASNMKEQREWPRLMGATTQLHWSPLGAGTWPNTQIFLEKLEIGFPSEFVNADGLTFLNWVWPYID